MDVSEHREDPRPGAELFGVDRRQRVPGGEGHQNDDGRQDANQPDGTVGQLLARAGDAGFKRGGLHRVVHVLNAGRQDQRHQGGDAGDKKGDVIGKIVNQHRANTVAEKHADGPCQRQQRDGGRGFVATEVTHEQDVVQHPCRRRDAVCRFRQIQRNGIGFKPGNWPGDNWQQQANLDEDPAAFNHVGNNA